MKNIKILGAGLSGLSAAINLARAGYNVDVFEKNDDCGKRFNGDINGVENWFSHVDVIREFEYMNIKTNYDCDPFKTVYLSDGTEIVKATRKKPIFYLVKRGIVENSLDQGLKNQAIDFGVNIHFNSKIKKENMDIISIGPAENRPLGVVKGICFETESDDIAVNLINKEASNRGYSYLLITKGYGTICSVNLYTRGVGADVYFKKTYEIFTDLFDIDIKNEKNVGGVGCFLLKPKLVDLKRRRYTGEAAGLQDILSGFGIRYAINSGFLAAVSIIENKNYKKLIKQRLLDRIKTSVVNRFLIDKYGDRYCNLLMKWAKNNDRWMEFAYRAYVPSLYSRAMYPFAKWYILVKYWRLL